MPQDLDRNTRKSIYELAKALYPEHAEEGEPAQDAAADIQNVSRAANTVGSAFQNAANSLYPDDHSPEDGSSNQSDGIVHVMRRGDTLWGLSRLYDVPLEDIQAVNPHITDPTRIPVGAKINIPGSGTDQGGAGQDAQNALAGTVHEIQHGDTLQGLSRFYGVPQEDIQAVNPHIADPTRIPVGTEINIPDSEADPGKNPVAKGAANRVASASPDKSGRGVAEPYGSLLRSANANRSEEDYLAEEIGYEDPVKKVLSRPVPHTATLKEIGFALRHPVEALKIGYVDKRWHNISTAASNFATMGEGPGSNYDSILGVGGYRHENTLTGEINAFRHTLWQATITRRFGVEDATEAGDAHEDDTRFSFWLGAGPNLKQRTFLIDSNNEKEAWQRADTLTDYLNNLNGRFIGTLVPKGAGMREIAERTLDYYHERGLWTAVQEGNVLKVVKLRLSDEKYKKLKAALQHKDDNGEWVGLD